MRQYKIPEIKTGKIILVINNNPFRIAIHKELIFSAFVSQWKETYSQIKPG